MNILIAIALLHDVLAAAGCYALWCLWRRWFGGADRRVSLIVGAGFVLRAFFGDLLFWISYLRLPIGRSLQIGDGLWFFGLDGWWYIRYANQIAQRGPVAVLFLDRIYPSHVFVQFLSAFVTLFGGPASVAIFLNCTAYLATCAIVVRLRERVTLPLLAALAAVAFGPGTIIWSLQPLKDMVLQLLIASLVGVCYKWQQRPNVFSGVAMIVLTFLIAGIRWYFAVITWGACAIFFLAVGLRAPRRAWALAASVVVFVLMSQAARRGGFQDMPPSVQRFFDPREVVSGWRPKEVTQTIAVTRRGFEHTEGATTIAAGPVIAPKPAAVAAKPPAPAATTQVARATPPARPAAAPSRPPATATHTTTTTTAAPVAVTSAPPAPQPPPATATGAQAPTETATATTTAAAAVTSTEPAPTTTTTAAPTATSAPAPTTSETSLRRRRRAHGAPPTTTAPVTTSVAPAPIVQPPAPLAPAIVPSTPTAPAGPVPSTFAGRMISGIAAAFLPRVVGEALGLIRIGGGRGLWLFAEVDTIAFDAVLLFAIVYIVRYRPRVTPLFVLFLMAFVLTLGPIIYTVNNFGTIFRLRQMFYFLAAILPVTLAPGSRE